MAQLVGFHQQRLVLELIHAIQRRWSPSSGCKASSTSEGEEIILAAGHGPWPSKAQVLEEANARRGALQLHEKRRTCPASDLHVDWRSSAPCAGSGLFEAGPELTIRMPLAFRSATLTSNAAGFIAIRTSTCVSRRNRRRLRKK